MDPAEVAAAVSSILPDVTPPAASSPSAPAASSPSVPQPPPSAAVALAERSHESLLQQLITVLDKMVALYEAGEGGARTPPARLESMLKESFNVVLGNRVRAGVPVDESGVAARAALSLPAWTASIDRTCADFQSHVSAALSSFLMSPASEPPPPPSVGSDRVSGWDLVVSGDAAPALGEEFCVQLDGLDRAEEEKEEEKGKKEEEEEANTSVMTDSEMVCLAVDRVETEAADESQSTASPGLNFGVDAEPVEERKEERGDGGLEMKLTEDDDLLQELFGSPVAEETTVACPVNDRQEVGLWTGHFVFLFRCQENPAAREVESLLTNAGAAFFDPYHPHLVPPDSRLSVLIHAADADRTQSIPNLLQLKNVRRIRFLLYADSLSCSLDQGTVLFPPAASCIVLDADTVATAHPDNLNSLINFLHEECMMNRPCRLVLHAQLRRLLSDMRLRCGDRYELFRMDQVTQLLTNSRHGGLIEWTGDPNQHVRPDALLFMQRVQRERQKAFRDFFLLSGLDPQSKRAHMFARSGIATMSLHDFIVNYTTKQFNEHSARPCLLTESCAEMMQEDSPLSWCIEVLPAYSSSVA